MVCANVAAVNALRGEACVTYPYRTIGEPCRPGYRSPAPAVSRSPIGAPSGPLNRCIPIRLPHRMPRPNLLASEDAAPAPRLFCVFRWRNRPTSDGSEGFANRLGRSQGRQAVNDRELQVAKGQIPGYHRVVARSHRQRLRKHKGAQQRARPHGPRCARLPALQLPVPSNYPISHLPSGHGRRRKDHNGGCPEDLRR